jgi:hypothetical protein
MATRRRRQTTAMENKKSENKRRKIASGNKKSSAKETAAAENDYVGELRESRWSVVSFDEVFAKNLTYEKAERKVARLKKQKISGLCIITDEAASRISPKKQPHEK